MDPWEQRQERERQHPGDVDREDARPHTEPDLAVAEEYEVDHAADDPRNEDRQQDDLHQQRLKREFLAEPERQQ